MKKRIITGLVLLAILIPALIVPSLLRVFEVILVIIAITSTIEILNMYEKKNHYYSTTIKVLAVISMLVLYFSIVNYAVDYFVSLDNTVILNNNLDNSLIRKVLVFLHLDKFMSPITALISMFIFFMAIMTLSREIEVSDVGRIYTAIIYVGVCVGALTVLRYLGVRFVIYLFSITVATDTFALVFGMAFGKHKMAPTISPKKTWEGAIGGSVVASIVGFSIIFFYPYISAPFHFGERIDFFQGVFNYENFTVVGKIFFALVLSTSISICSQIGDLVASKLKRNYGIKDYSQVFPGHGGVLDRFDSAFFASAIFILFIICEMKLYAPIFPIQTIGVFIR